MGVVIGLVGALVGRTLPSRIGYEDLTTSQETERLKRAYGPHHYSQSMEEWIIRDVFRDRREGSFVDVRSSHYRMLSNTFYLEERLGWSGIAIDPQAALEADYKKFRPRTRFFPLFVSDVSNETTTVYVPRRSLPAASSSRQFAERFSGDIAEITAVPTVTLTDLLGRLRVERIDLLSIDVELSEPRVLAGFDIRRFEPALVCIEAHADVRQQILDYFAKAGYVALGRYLRVDEGNLYFSPLQ